MQSVCILQTLKETFSPKLRPENERYRLIAENPVAGARFFHFMVAMLST